VTLLNGTAASGSGPNDLAVASEGGASFLYVVDAGTSTVGAFQVNLANGSLTPITGVAACLRRVLGAWPPFRAGFAAATAPRAPTCGTGYPEPR
jgi:hypothetical protein